MKLLIAILVAAMALGAADGHAQTTSTATTASTSAAGASAGILANIVVPGSGAAASAVAASSLGSLANPQFVMGQTTIGPSVTSYDACSRTRSGSIGPLGAGWSQTDDDCARQRQAEFLRQMGLISEAYEVMCGIKAIASADWNTGRMACRDNQLARDKANAQARPVAAPTAIVPVVAPAAVVAAPQPAGREVCLNTAGREVPAGTRGASCGFVGS